MLCPKCKRKLSVRGLSLGDKFLHPTCGARLMFMGNDSAALLNPEPTRPAQPPPLRIPERTARDIPAEASSDVAIGPAQSRRYESAYDPRPLFGERKGDVRQGCSVCREVTAHEPESAGVLSAFFDSPVRWCTCRQCGNRALIS